MMTKTNKKVLRSVFLDSEMDETLRQAAFRLNVSKGELIRTYVERGINEERQTARMKPGYETMAANHAPAERSLELNAPGAVARRKVTAAG